MELEERKKSDIQGRKRTVVDLGLSPPSPHEGLAPRMVSSISRGGIPLSLCLEKRRLFGDTAMFIESRGLEMLPS